MILLLPCLLAAGEHELPGAPELPPASAIPPGEPRVVRVSAGSPVQPVIRGLPAGSTVVLGPGVHAGPVILDRSLTLRGEGATLEGGGEGTVLTVVADDVVVRDLHVSGSGESATRGDAGVRLHGRRLHVEGLVVERALTGFDLRGVEDTVLRGNRVYGRTDLPMGLRGDGIRLWESYRITLESNTLDQVRDLVVWYSYDTLIQDNRVTRSRYGVHFMHADRNRVLRNTFTDDVVGVFAMYSDQLELAENLVAAGRGAAGVGLGFKESSELLVRDNRVLGSTTGLYLDTTPHRDGTRATFLRNTVAFNLVGVRFHAPQAGADFQANRFHENQTPVAVDGNADATVARFDGNQWSDYAGYDLDRDGIGDVPYESRGLTDSLRDRRPALAFFRGTPAAWLLDLLGSLLPLFAPPTLVRDPAPRMDGP